MAFRFFGEGFIGRMEFFILASRPHFGKDSNELVKICITRTDPVAMQQHKPTCRVELRGCGMSLGFSKKKRMENCAHRNV